MGQDPDRVQPGEDAKLALVERLRQRRQRLGPESLDGELRLDAPMLTLQVKLGDPPGERALLPRRLDGLRLSLRHNPVNPPPATLGTLPIRPVGDEQGAVAADHDIGRLEAIGIGLGPGRELDLLHRPERAAGARERIADDGPAPLAEEEVAAILRRERRLKVADAAGGGAEAQVGQRRQRLIGVFVIEVGIAVVGPEEAVADADLVVATVVLVVAHEDVEIGVEGDVVDVAQAAGEDVQVAAVGPATEDAAADQDEAVPFGPLDVAAMIAEGEVEPAVVPHDDAVGAVQPDRVRLGRQPQAGEEVLALVSLAVPAQHGEERRVHDVDGAVVIANALDGVEAGGVDGGLVGVATAVGILDQADLIAADDLRPEAGHVIDGDEERIVARADSDDGGVFDERVAGEEGGFEAFGQPEGREALLRLRPGPRLGGKASRVAGQGYDDNESK
ncbi:MAG: hypothetical protein U0793_00800 [Gemmataceae bacterium]